MFELAGGHQQVLTKITVWFVGFFPGNYVQNLIISNILFALFGFYFIIISQLKYKPKIYSPIILVLPTLVALNFKPLYLYMSATGLGLCQSIFFIGIYFYASNREQLRISRVLILLSLFLSPFTTGMGLALTISHGIYLSYKFFTGKNKTIKSMLPDSIVITTSLFFAYLLPTISNNISSRTLEVTSIDSHRLILFLYDPINFISFSLALIGNPLIPSSRLDPYIPIGLGILVIILFAIIVFRLFDYKNITKIIFSNKNPILTGVAFIYLISSFRSSGEYFSLDSAAPRFIFGAILLLLGIQSIILNNYSSVHKRVDKIIVFSLIILTTFSISGIKTGMEWIKVRSLQSTKLYDCILNSKADLEICSNEANIIREANSSNKDLEIDLNMLKKYFINKKIL